MLTTNSSVRSRCHVSHCLKSNSAPLNKTKSAINKTSCETCTGTVCSDCTYEHNERFPLTSVTRHRAWAYASPCVGLRVTVRGPTRHCAWAYASQCVGLRVTVRGPTRHCAWAYASQCVGLSRSLHRPPAYSTSLKKRSQ
jgi:hypothetical protein